jgi:nucleolar pre-ribosomal-associated protein 1
MGRDAVPAAANSPHHDTASVARLSTLHSLLLAHALRCIFYPSTAMYPLIMRFLLQRPQVDTTDVPMLFASLYSTTDEWRQERRWIIHFIADGMAQSQDWTILTRRHVWDLLSTIFQTTASDNALRHGILEVVSLVKNPIQPLSPAL